MIKQIGIVLGYGVAGAVVVIGTIILIAYGSGYFYDFKTGRLVQRGLLLLDSTPGGATITLGD